MYVLQINSDQHISDITELAHSMHQECASHLPFFHEAVERNAKKIIVDNKNANAWIVYSHDHKAIGFFVGLICEYSYNNSLFAEQSTWYILPEHRSTIAGSLLIDAFELWATEIGVLEIFVGLRSSKDDEKIFVDNMFGRRGYNRSGAFYVKEFKQ